MSGQWKGFWIGLVLGVLGVVGILSNNFLLEIFFYLNMPIITIYDLTADHVFSIYWTDNIYDWGMGFTFLILDPLLGLLLGRISTHFTKWKKFAFWFVMIFLYMLLGIIGFLSVCC